MNKIYAVYFSMAKRRMVKPNFGTIGDLGKRKKAVDTHRQARGTLPFGFLEK